jgi:hypothetical protein
MKRLWTLVGYALVALSAILAIVLRFTYPDKTEARILLDHWEQLMACVLVAMLGLLSIMRGEYR